MRSVAQTKPSNRLELNDDGTARRKYDVEDAGDESKPILRSTIGLVLANAIILVKNVFFSSEPASAAGPQQQGGSQQAQQQSASDGDAPAEEDPVEQGDGPGDKADDADEHDHVGSGTRFSLTSAPAVDIDPELAPIHFRVGSGRIASSNDNESLYGARPGHGIGLHGDSIAHSGHGGSHHHGGGHGGGGSGGDDTGSSGHNPGDHDDDDDDEDDDSNHGPGGGSGNPDTPRQNRLPVVLAPLILGTLLADEARAITIGDLLAHASDPDGDTLTVQGLTASSGKLVANDGGGWTFTPDEGDTSAVTFTYRISDGKGSVAQHASLDLVPRPAQHVITGTAGHDLLVGTPDIDIMEGLAGDDVIYGREGNDVIFGGDGNDRLIGGAGDDVIFGGAGDDVIFGNDGDDVLHGGPGRDIIDGGKGKDTIRGDADDDTLDGGDDDDLVSGDEGNDKVKGGDGNDTLLGGSGDDDIEGGNGKDTATGGSGKDKVALNSGNDTAIAEQNDDDDNYDGGEGTDTYDTSATSADASIDLTAGTASSSAIGNDTVVAFENVTSGAGDDHITGTETANVVNAGGGSDTVAFGGGDDTAVAQANDGNDHYDGGTGADTYDASTTTADAAIDLTAGTATSADIGNDTVVGFEHVTSGSGDDVIGGTDAANIVNGGAGDDTVTLVGGNDTAVAQANDGNDHYDGGAGSDTYDASGTSADAAIDLVAQTAVSDDIGHDTIANFENVVAGSGNDTIVCGDDANVVDAGAGSDTVTLAGGNDTVVASAGDGDDTYNGGAGDDTYDLSSTSADALIDLISQSVTSVDVGRDIIVSFENVSGGKGNDTIVASDARNILIGGEGDDSFQFHSSASIGHGRGSRDQILDFSVGDRIDIDKVRDEFADDLSGNFADKDIERFVILKDQDSVFSRPGELKIQYDSFDGHDVTIIQGNTDFDSDAEFELELAGHYIMTDDDFYRA